MMDWLDPSEDDWNYILPLRDAYVKSRGKSLWEAEIPEEFMGDLLTMIERSLSEVEYLISFEDIILVYWKIVTLLGNLKI